MKVLLAVSGGIDSMTMADIMFSHSRLYESLAVAHCNFHLRPGDCDEDEKLVGDWAAAHGLQFFRKDFDTEAYAKENGVSIEMAAREMRYRWFAELCAEHGFDAVAVAHNANDNAETLILNLVRGTGLRGLTGMSASSDCGRRLIVKPSAPQTPSFRFAEFPPSYSAEGGIGLPTSRLTSILPSIIRPLLGMTRREIEDYATVHHVEYRTDKTNFETEYKRNKVRNLVFPVFEQMNPSFVKTVSRDIKHFAAASDIVDDWCSEYRPLVMVSENEISTEELLKQPHWEYLLYTILSDFGFNESVVDSVCQLLKSDDKTLSGKKFHSPDYLLITTSDKIIIQALPAALTADKTSAPQTPPIASLRSPLLCCRGSRGRSQQASLCLRPEQQGSARRGHSLSVVSAAGEGCRSIAILPYEKGMNLKCGEGEIVFDADKVPETAVVRGWQAGDWLVPFGMKGRKKLSDLFTDLHYDLIRKQQALVLAPADSEDHHVYAVLGVKIDDSIKVTDSTERIARFKL